MKTSEITVEYIDHMAHAELLAAVHYDPLTGIFTRRKSAGNAKAGTRIGSRCSKGYLKAKVLGEYVKLHRLAWFYMRGCGRSKKSTTGTRSKTTTVSTICVTLTHLQIARTKRAHAKTTAPVFKAFTK